MPPDLSVPAGQEIFVYRPGAIGDTLLTLPALAALRRRFRGCRVTFAGNLACLPLLPVDEALASDDPRLLGLFEERPRSWRRFDYHVIFASGPRGLLPGVRRSAREAESRGQHVADWLVDAIDPTFPEREPRLPSTAPAERWSDGLVLHVGAGSPAKCWPAECFADVATALEMPLAVVRGPADEPAVGRFLECLPDHLRGAEVWSGLTLAELAARLRGVALFVGNDSGITHLAAALGVPSLALH
ncbi:MAG: glycosyltransferase family 9 protein, partial [Chloroflexota bacterium]